jgi:hypothetical protein
MPHPVLSDKVIKQTLAAYVKANGPARSLYVVGRELNISAKTLRRHLEVAEARGIPVPPRSYIETEAKGATLAQQQESRARKAAAAFDVPSLPDDDLDAEEIVAQAKAAFKRKQAHEKARRLIPVRVNVDGPVGILHFGDPHVDDAGTDLELLDRHSDLTREYPFVWGANVGDTTNNWTGRLAALYAAQNMGRSRAIKVAERFIKRTRWLYMIGGNHDAWSGDDDPIRWIARDVGTLYQSSECRIQLNFPDGDPIRINGRHDFAGHSQWNPAHGPMKAAMMGVRDHIMVAGHRHESAHGVVKDPTTGIVCHALKVASYKVYDRYARDRGFRDQALGPAAFTILQPHLPDYHPDRVIVTWDPEVGVELLKALRSAQGLPYKPARS